MKVVQSVLLFLGLLSIPTVQADPQLTSWVTGYSTKYARIYTSDANKLAGVTATTWSNNSQMNPLNQSLPAYAGIQKLVVS